MNDLNMDALRVSQALDDHTTRRLDERFGPQERVHAALSRRGAIPAEHPSVDIHARVMARLGPAHIRKSSRTIWPLGLAASLTLLAGLGWLIVRSTSPAPMPIPQGPVTVKNESTAAATFAALVNPLTKSDGQLHASIEGPFLEQARLIRDDTQQGMDMVLSRLPLGSASPIK